MFEKLRFLRCPHLMTLLFAVIAAAALGMALISQYFFGLEPCILCIWQRYPYGIVIGLGILGFIACYKNPKLGGASIGLIGVTLIVNSVIAFYHTGVELKWWPSHLEGCAVPKMDGDMTQILADIQNRTKAVRCDEIPWSDPILNLSMANYNVIFCLGLGLIAFYSAYLILKRQP